MLYGLVVVIYIRTAHQRPTISDQPCGFLDIRLGSFRGIPI
ncbi:hypothetical protein SDC9_162863 [bioreactor metagenome]|uniref:Uncharacterized protein n=1 Tax=bioreactor metagenome TaxID=1076179 RepID=A0A645FQ88_9ZZZZ